ncbi:hypothetical protein [Vreelandella aquamarina]|uniref:hypothetical protein n=1 Tax=Vreelandella aquamarina TaxID=77097 RepID=UPI00384FEDFE
MAGSEPTPDEIEDGVDTLYTNTISTLNGQTTTGTVAAANSDNLNNAIIDEQLGKYQKAVTDAQADVDEIAGLNDAVESLATAQAGFETSLEAQADTAATLAGAVTSFNTANSSVTATAYSFSAPTGNSGTYTAGGIDLTDLQEDDKLVQDGSSNAIITVNASGDIIVADAYADSSRAQQLLDAVKADVAAIQAVAQAESTLEGAVADIMVLEGDAEIDGSGITAGDILDQTGGSKLTSDGKLYVKDGVVYARDNAAASNEVDDMYAITDLTVSNAAGTDVAVKWDSTDGADGSFKSAATTTLDVSGLDFSTNLIVANGISISSASYANADALATALEGTSAIESASADGTSISITYADATGTAFDVTDGATTPNVAAVVSGDITVGTENGFEEVTANNLLAFDADDFDASGYLALGDEANNYLDGSFATDATESAALNTAENNLEDYEEAITEYRDAKALADQLEGLNTDITEAREAIENSEEDGGLGVNLREGDDNFTTQDDVYLYNEEGGNQSLSGFEPYRDSRRLQTLRGWSHE